MDLFDRRPIMTRGLGIVVLGAGWLLAAARQPAIGQEPSPAADQPLRLRTDELPTPLVFPNEPERRVTSVELDGVVHGAAHGKGLLTFHANTLTFDEFGDPTVVEADPGRRVPVILRRIRADDPRERRRSYEIRFATGSFPKRLHLVLSDGAPSPHRLLIAGITAPENRELALEQALDLHGAPAVEEPSPDLPQGPQIRLETLAPNFDRLGGGLRPVRIFGPLDGLVTFEADPNIFSFDGFGDVSRSTFMGFHPAKVTLNPVDLPDPAGRGRRLFTVDLKPGPATYALVLAGTKGGPHRLLIKEGNVLTHVLPLHEAAPSTGPAGDGAKDR